MLLLNNIIIWVMQKVKNNSSQKNFNLRDSFDLSEKVAVITGGGGLLGEKHAEAINEYGGTSILLDINKDKAMLNAKNVTERYGGKCIAIYSDITDPNSLQSAKNEILDIFGKIDILINNAANNPKVEDDFSNNRLEKFSLEKWNNDLNVGLTGAFLCSKVFGKTMAHRKQGNILNIASDLASIAPDQRIYKKMDIENDHQPVKPVSYSVIKSGLIGLTRYLATYWIDKGVRCNALLPGGIFNNQEEEFVNKLTNLIPMGRMADLNEYKGAVAFLVSNASSYMNGSLLTIDGGRTCW